MLSVNGGEPVLVPAGYSAKLVDGKLKVEPVSYSGSTEDWAAKEMAALGVGGGTTVLYTDDNTTTPVEIYVSPVR